MRHLLTAGVFLAGLSIAQAQTVTPGIGGVAITGQSGAGVYIPWNGGGTVIGAPGVGSYNLGTSAYVSPYSWNQYSNPYAYNFNTGTFNYNSGVYGWNNGLTTSSYYGSPYSSGVIQTGGYYYPSSGSYYYPSNTVYYGNGYDSSWGNRVIYSSGNGRGRGRWR